jgi:hypothetical protein
MRLIRWPDGTDAWIAANPNATYDDCVAAGYCVDRTEQAWYSKKHKEKGRRLMLVADVIVGEQTVKEPPSDAECEEYFALLEAADEIKGNLAPTQDSTEFHAPDDGLPIGIAMTGDWHAGSGGVAYGRLKRDLETIRDTPGLYAVGMGDFLEGVNTEVKARSALYGGLFNDGGWQERMVLLRAKIAQGKWLAIMAGNHDEWQYKTAGITRTDQLARELGAPYFCQGGGTIFAHVGAHRYVVAVTHNAKGNSKLNTTNAQRRTFDDWPQWDNCDVIACGHLHFNDLQVATRKSGRCIYLRSGTYKLRDGYAADNGFTPEWGVPIAILLPDEHRVLYSRGDDFYRGVEYLTFLRAQYAAAQAA